MSQIKAGFLGDFLSFHYIAARQFFGPAAQLQGFPSFDSLTGALQSDIVQHIIIAVENTVAGDVPGNFQRIAESGFSITGEIVLDIRLQLGARAKVPVSDITQIFTHPMARKETSRFFASYPHILFTDSASTSTAVRQVAEQSDIHVAAIGSLSAIQHYGLAVIASDIDDHLPNSTRFLILSNKFRPEETTNAPVKASLVLKPGSNKIADDPKVLFGPLNLTTTKTLVNGNVYLEIIMNQGQTMASILENLAPKDGRIEVLGVYTKGEIILS